MSILFGGMDVDVPCFVSLIKIMNVLCKELIYGLHSNQTMETCIFI